MEIIGLERQLAVFAIGIHLIDFKRNISKILKMRFWRN